MDKLDTVLKGACSWSPRFEEVRGELRSTSPQIQFRKSKDYAAVIDMRPVMDVDALVDFQSRFRGDHKIEILNAGEKSFEQCLDIIAQITDEHPLPLEVRRVDLCANTPDAPVSWYAATIRAQWKQWEAKIGTVKMADPDGRVMQWSEIGKRALQTIYLGRRPNCFRIYDKTAEQFVRYQQAHRAHLREVQKQYQDSYLKDGADYPDAMWVEVLARLAVEFPFPAFDAWSGLTLSTVLTRVEREMAVGRVPEKLDRVYKLKQELADFNPFTRLKGFDSGASCVIDESDWSPVDLCAGRYMLAQLRSGEMSKPQLYHFLNRDRNGSRYEKKFRPFLEAATRNGNGVSAQQLFENYRETVTRQLAA